MRILVVCPLLPYPPLDGGRKSVYYPLRQLALNGHEIHFFCLTEKEDPDAVHELSSIWNVETVVSPKRPTLGGAIRSLGGAMPYDLARFHNVELLRRVREHVRTKAVDVVQVEGIHAAFYALELQKECNLPMVMRVHNVQSLNMARAAERYANHPLRWWLRFDTLRVRRYEAIALARLDCNMVVSREERDYLLGLNPAIRCEVVRMGVDLQEFSSETPAEDPGTVLWMGALNWIPNRDSFWWFFREIVPLIVKQRPDVKIRVVGSNPPEDILAVQHPNVEIVGFVPDIRQAIGRAQVCVVPLQVGSGVRIKLLEMFAMSKAVVATPVGCEGLDVTNDEHLLVANSPGPFAGAVTRLLSDPNLRDRLGKNAREYVHRGYSWESVAQQYESVYRIASLRKKKVGIAQ